MDFKEVFDVGSLDDYQLGHLQYVLNSPSYGDVFQPYLQRVRDSLAAKILDPSDKRKSECPDDFLRGAIITIDGLLNLFSRLINETEMELIERTQLVSTKNQYQLLREAGLMQPITGLPNTEYRPEEDY